MLCSITLRITGCDVLLRPQMLHHTWYEERRFGGKPSLQEQCEMSASTHPADIIAGELVCP